jgi:hypothetical protein
MVSVTFSFDEESKHEMERFSWVNWSELAREIFLKRIKKEEALRRLNELMKDSEMTEELAMQLGEELKERIYKRIKAKSG